MKKEEADSKRQQVSMIELFFKSKKSSHNSDRCRGKSLMRKSSIEIAFKYKEMVNAVESSMDYAISHQDSMTMEDVGRYLKGPLSLYSTFVSDLSTPVLLSP